MVQQAEAHAAEARQRREQIDTKNIADSSAYQAEKLTPNSELDRGGESK